jgi:hypothetical protein
MLLVETSSQETYGGTIQFYERTGYELVGKIKDYYKSGDDKLIFAKRLGAGVSADVSGPLSAGNGLPTPRELVAETLPMAQLTAEQS